MLSVRKPAFLLRAMMMGSAWTLSGCSGAPDTLAAVQEQRVTSRIERSAEVTVSLNSKERLSFVFIDAADGAKAQEARTAYTETVFPLARTYGLASELSLDVIGTGAGSFEPQRVALFSWPDEDAERAFGEEPAFIAAKAARPDGWDHLRIMTLTLDEPLRMSLNPSKTYTLATAWYAADRPGDYEAYLEGIEEAVANIGGRFVQEFYAPDYETHTAPFEAPDQLTLVEWPTPASLPQFLKSSGFIENADLLASGTTRFELVVLSVPPT